MRDRYVSQGARALEGRAGITIGARYLDHAATGAGSPLTFLHWSRDALETIEQAQLEAVARARLAGAAWSQIGYWLGCSAQAAHQRFAARLEEADIGDVPSTPLDEIDGQISVADALGADV